MTSTITSSTAIGRCEFEEFWIDNLVSLCQNVHQILGLLGIVGSEKCVRGSCALGAASTTDTVDVILGTVGVVEVDDKFDIIHI